MEILQVKTVEDFEKAIVFANESFNLDFKKFEPKIYRNFRGGKTFVCKDGGRIVGMFSTYEFVYKSLKCMSVGTVCVAKDYRNRGIMSGFFDYLKKCDYFGSDLVTLCGDRKRYEHFGFARVVESYSYKLKVNKASPAALTVAADGDAYRLFEIYNRRNIGVKRPRRLFFDILSTAENTVYLATEKGKVSYCVYNPKKNVVLETYGDIDEFDVISAVGRAHASEEIHVCAPYNRHDETFSANAKSYVIELILNLKIINVPKFIEKTCVSKKNELFRFSFSVDEKGYVLTNENGKLKVGLTEKTTENKYDGLDFAYALFGFCGRADEISEYIRPVIPNCFNYTERI